VKTARIILSMLCIFLVFCFVCLRSVSCIQLLPMSLDSSFIFYLTFLYFLLR